MAKRSQTETAVLGALSVEAMSGYALRAAITGTLGHFWRESFGQIYPALARAEADGYVRRVASGMTSGSVFELTGSGDERLRALLLEPDEPTPPRNGLLLRLFFGRSLGVRACVSLLRDVEVRASEALLRYEDVRAELAAEDDPGAPFRMLTVTYGIAVARAQRDWARESITVLGEARD
ncbi:MAG: PadR family transcriptional regulator [Cellulomonadaceae bacterium]|nr:PadR family transcriptional regulator [Cellulomonadaceae bacterium]